MDGRSSFFQIAAFLLREGGGVSPATLECRLIQPLALSEAQAEPALQKVLAQLKVGQELPPPRETLYDRFMSGPVNPVFYRFFVKANAFRATDACIGCGKCVELCLLNNIHLENGKPVWGKNCTHCMACICYCPKEAIEYGKKSKGKPRYHFEALKEKRDV